eukprot:scaffold3072_cov116-Isochrysis_galbana.AAC.10
MPVRRPVGLGAAQGMQVRDTSRQELLSRGNPDAPAVGQPPAVDAAVPHRRERMPQPTRHADHLLVGQGLYQLGVCAAGRVPVPEPAKETRPPREELARVGDCTRVVLAGGHTAHARPDQRVDPAWEGPRLCVALPEVAHVVGPPRVDPTVVRHGQRVSAPRSQSDHKLTRVLLPLQGAAVPVTACGAPDGAVAADAVPADPDR